MRYQHIQIKFNNEETKIYYINSIYLFKEVPHNNY